MDRESPVNLRVEMAPDDGPVLLSGSITITRTTLSVFKLCETGDEEPLFIGVCSVPLLKIAREKSRLFTTSESLLLMGFSDHLFVNASLSAGLLPMKQTTAASTRSASSRICVETPNEERSVDILQRVDNPALWKRLRLEFQSPEDCDRCAEALFARKAEEITCDTVQSLHLSSDFGKFQGVLLSKAQEVTKNDSLTSASSYYGRNGQSALGNSDNMYTCRSQLVCQEEGQRSCPDQLTNNKSHAQSNNDNKELNTPSDGRTRQYVQQSRGTPLAYQQGSSHREKLTPSDSCDDRNTIRSSHRSRRLPERSHPTDSCRELNTPIDGRTRQYVQQGRDTPFAYQQGTSHREKLTPSDSCDDRKALRSNNRGHRLPENSDDVGGHRGFGTSSDANTAPGSLFETVHDVRKRLSPAHGVMVDGNASGKVLQPADTTAGVGRGVWDMQVLDGAAGKTQRFMDNGGHHTSVAYGSKSSAHMSRQSNTLEVPTPCLSPSESPATRRCGGGRSEKQLFLRSVMKFMHHRLHLMQYLHRELVHQAYLVEEAKLCVDRGRSVLSASFGRPMSRPTSISPRSPRRTAQSSVAEESLRLREIEERLRTVEKLHEEAGQERQEALRLRCEAERKLELINREMDSLRNASCSLGNNIDLHKYNLLNGGSSTINGAKFPSLKNENPDPTRPSAHSKACESVVSLTSKQSCIRLADRQLVALPSFDKIDLQHIDTLSEMDYCTTIVDRYIYGDEWHLLYPLREADVRFNALIDTCLMLKLPRRLITITNVSVDKPGLRITAEIRHDSSTLPRDVIERRFTSQPFYFLQRFYELRHYVHGDSGSTPFQSRIEQRASRSLSRGVTSRGHNRNGASHNYAGNEYIYSFNGDDSMFDYGAREQETRMREIQRRTTDRFRQRERDVADERERKQMALQRERWRQQVDQLEQEESYRRGRIVLCEAKERQNMNIDSCLGNWLGIMIAPHALEEEESLQRAIIEVAYVRQLQVLAQAQRKNWAFVRLFTQETERRMRIAEQEREDRIILCLIMNPQRLTACATQTEIDEQRHRQRLIEAEENQRRQISANIWSFLIDALQNAIDALIGDEKTERMMIVADEMKEWLDVLCSKEAPRSRGLSSVAAVTPQLWQVLLADEAAGRSHIVNDEERRRRFLQREFIVTTEDVERNVIELQEMDEHIAMLDDIVHRNRAMLERRRQERKELVQLATEEQYYRKGILGDEQDEWEVLMELFDTEQNEILLEAARLATSVSEFESPQRRRCLQRSPRQTKPFHYMTFVPSDMDYPPSAALVIEGILGCSVNKNLEVTNIARRLLRDEGEELQFQAGDMILDVAGYSLHSISHLREVLSNRTMQIQCEAAEEFAGIAEDELTTNPALQKYIEVLCEHHNFLVQVLRGCDIFQIIVKS